LFGDMLLRGTKTHTREQIENELDFMGASLSVDAGFHSLSVSGQTLSRNMDRFLALVTEILTEPTFPEEELTKLREETIAQIYLRLEEDAQIARLKFMEIIYGRHPYGHDLMGSPTSLKKITRSDLVTFYNTNIQGQGFVVGVAGDLTRSKLDEITKQLAQRLPEGKSAPKEILFQGKISGRHILLIDKPQRTQTHFLIGHPGIPLGHKDYFPLAVFMTTFGGHMFQAKYMQEIRVKRGWAYGAYGAIDARRDGGGFYLYTYPATKDTVPALKLSLELLDEAIKKGLTDEDLKFAKTYLQRSYPFLIDTPEKIVGQRISNRFMGLPDNHLENYAKNIESVTLSAAREAAKKHLSTENVQIVMLCTAKEFKETIGKELSAKTVDVVPFDRF